MSHSAFFLVILAGLIHAIWNIAAKKAVGDARFICLSDFILVIIWAPVGIYLGWDVVPKWGWNEWRFIVASGFLHTLYFVVLLRGYRKADLTVVYPLARGSGPLISSFAALFLLDEKISVLGIIGILSVVSGVLFIAGGHNLFRVSFRSGGSHHQRVHKGIFYGVLTGIFISGYTLLDGYAVKVLLLSPILLFYFGNFFQILLLLPSLKNTRLGLSVLSPAQWKYAFMIALISPVSYVLVLYALQTAPLSQVAPAREVSMLFAALIGGRLLGEGDRVQRMLGALLIAVGVIVLGVA